MPITVTTPEGDAKRQVTTDAGAYPFQNVTLAQALTAVAGVTDLPSARTFLGHAVRKVFDNDARIKILEAQVAYLMKQVNK
jgi:hypothetical protein